MLNNLDCIKLKSKDKNAILDYDKYIYACEKIARDISSKYDLRDLELVGMARGALPLIVTISHMLGIREVSIIQTTMTKSDKPYDYGDFNYVSDNILPTSKSCILFEDIIYKGTTTFGALNILKNKNKNVLSVYSLVIDDSFKKIYMDDSIDINYVFEINQDDWVHFFWEENINKLDYGEEILWIMFQ